MKKLYNFFYGASATVFVFGLLYFFYHVLAGGNLWQSLASFFIGATIASVLMGLLAMARNSEDNMYELAMVDLQKQLKDAENNYDLMRQANQSLQKDKDLLRADINRQANIICDMANKNNKLFIDLDIAKAKLLRASIGTSKIDPKGNIV